MQDKKLNQLLDKFEKMLTLGKNIYFDPDEYDSIIEYYDQIDNLDKAKYVLALGQEIHPDSDLLKLRQARFMMYDNLYLETLDYLNANFTIYDFDLFLLKIECYLSLHLYAEAYTLTQEVLEDKDNDMDIILSELGYVYLETEYIKDALLYLESSLKYNSQNEEVLSELILIYESQEDYLKAIEYCDKLLDIDAYNADVWLLQGKLYTLTGHYDKAIDSFEFYSTIKDDDLSSLRIKAHCLILLGRLVEAISLLLECIDMAPSEEVLYASLLDCYIDLEQFDQALSIIDLYEQRNGILNPVFIAKKAFAYLKLSNHPKALFFIRQALEIDGNSYDINIVAVDIYSDLNLITEALTICDVILSKAYDNLFILNKAVDLSVSIKDYERTIFYQKKIFDITNTTESKQKLILLYLENGDEEQYLEQLESCDKETLLSLFFVFYKEKLIDKDHLSENYLLLRLREIYYARLDSKNIKH